MWKNNQIIQFIYVIPSSIFHAGYYLLLCIILVSFTTLSEAQYTEKLKKADSYYTIRKSQNSSYFFRLKSVERSLNYKNLCILHQHKARDLATDLKISNYYKRYNEDLGPDFHLIESGNDIKYRTYFYGFTRYKTI